MFENLRRDKARYTNLGSGPWYTYTGFWIVAIYRFGVWTHSIPNSLLRIPMRVLYRLLRLPNRIFNVVLWGGATGARIGPGLCIIHPDSIYIGAGVEIGENCLMMHDITLAVGHLPGTPKIGNNVDIYVGARILGGVVVGDNSMLGANCVVTRDVPSESVVLAAPSRVLPRSLLPRARKMDPAGATSTERAPPAPPP